MSDLWCSLLRPSCVRTVRSPTALHLVSYIWHHTASGRFINTCDVSPRELGGPQVL